MQEIQQIEERAAVLAEQAAAAEGLEGTVDEVVARYGTALCFTPSLLYF